MAKKSSNNMIGSWAFLIGVVLALILGLFVYNLSETMAIILVVIGLVVGLLNVTESETQPFLMSGAILIIVSAIGEGAIGTIEPLSRVLTALLFVFVPATIIVSIRNVFSLARA